MIRTFRPWQILERPRNNHLEIDWPQVPGTTSRTVFMLETALLVAAARIVEAKSILEIGTCMGYTAMHLAMNTDAMITSLDIEYKPQVWRDTEYRNQILYVIGDEPRANYKADMVFIDANHDYAHVKRDTYTAIEAEPRLIAWHDYSNPMEPGVMRFLSEFAGDHDLIHVQDSWLCFWFRNDL